MLIFFLIHIIFLGPSYVIPKFSCHLINYRCPLHPFLCLVLLSLGLSLLLPSSFYFLLVSDDL